MDHDVEHDKHDEKQTHLPSSTTETQHSDGISILCEDSDKDDKYAVCRVCQCAESDRRGDVALGFLNIFPLLKEDFETNESGGIGQVPAKSTGMESKENNFAKNSGFVEFISPNGEVFVCKKNLEAAGLCYEQDMLVNLGCSCKSDLALAHYACALKWFINRGSLICEICETEAGNIRAEDFKRVLASLKEYESLKERTATGECSHTRIETNSGVDPDAVAAIRRQRLSEISLWFVPHNNSATTFQPVTDQSVIFLPENASLSERSTTRWAVDGTGILLATGLLTVTLAWLIAPHVGKKTAKNGLHILLGGICALTVVIFLRFVVLSRIKYGPARYWAILFVFWFLVFGVWASRTHGAHST